MGSVYYGYDPNDRLTLTSWVTGATLSSETYSYTSGTNRLASLTDSSGTRSPNTPQFQREVRLR